MGYPGITQTVTYPWISKDKYVCTYLYQLFAFLRWKNEQLYKSGLVRLTLCILFHTKYQRDMQRKVKDLDIQGYL